MIEDLVTMLEVKSILDGLRRISDIWPNYTSWLVV